MTTVRDIMRRDLITLEPAELWGDARRVMRLARLRHVPVVRDGILVGLLSYRDLADASLDAARAAPARDALRREVGDLVQRPPVTIEPEGSLPEAVTRMLALHVGCLPVATSTAEGLRLIGLVTEADLLRAAFRA